MPAAEGYTEAGMRSRTWWKLPMPAFIVGTVLGRLFPWPVQLLLIPGFSLIIPIYVLTGGVN
jgi:hypothetical protein